MKTTEPVKVLVEARRDDRKKIILIDSRELFQGMTEVQIVHRDQYYRLKVTNTEKLILNK